MKITATLAALAVAANAATDLNSMLPFLMMNGGGGAYYYYDPITNANLGRSTRVSRGGNFNSMLPFLLNGDGLAGDNNLGLMMAMQGGRGFSGNSAMLPFLLNNNGAAADNNNLGLMLAMQGGRGFSGSSAVPMMLAANNGKIDTNTALMMSMGQRGGFGGNAMLPFMLSQNDGKINANTAMMMSFAGGNGGFANNPMLPLLLQGDGAVDAAALTTPLLINSFAQGRSPSLSRDVIPALAMAGGEITTQSLLPWMMTSGQRYLGGDMGTALALSGGLGNLDTNTLLPYVVADSFGPGRVAGPRFGYSTRRVV